MDFSFVCSNRRSFTDWIADREPWHQIAVFCGRINLSPPETASPVDPHHRRPFSSQFATSVFLFPLSFICPLLQIFVSVTLCLLLIPLPPRCHPGLTVVSTLVGHADCISYPGFPRGCCCCTLDVLPHPGLQAVLPLGHLDGPCCLRRPSDHFLFF